MRLDDGHKRAIARVDVSQGGTPTSRGTGFLVVDGLLLTAAHVLFDEAGALRGDTISLTFGTTVSWPAGTEKRVQATIAKDPATGRELYDRKRDWAFLACTPPGGVAPLPLGRLRDGYDEPHWATFGYGEATEAGKTVGQPYSGTIEDRSTGYFTLHVTQAAAGKGSDLSGVSGAPCMVHGQVIGMLTTAALADDGKGLAAVEGRAYATPIGLIARACSDVVRPVAAVAVPYEGLLVDALGAREGMARAIGGVLEVDRADQLPIAELRLRIVGELFRRGYKTAVDVAIAHFEDLAAGAEQIVDLAETFWVPDLAAEQLSKLIARPHKARAAALNTADRTIATQYLRRAGTLHTKSRDGWRLRAFPIDDVAGELDLAELEQRIRDHFADAYGARTDKAIKRVLVDERPCLLLLRAPVPREEILEAIEAKFEGIYVVLLTGQAWTPKPGRIDFVLPEIGPGEEERILDGRAWQRTRFERRKAQK